MQDYETTERNERIGVHCCDEIGIQREFLDEVRSSHKEGLKTYRHYGDICLVLFALYGELVNFCKSFVREVKTRTVALACSDNVLDTRLVLLLVNYNGKYRRGL